MKTIRTAVNDKLLAGTNTLCVCLRIERTDGVKYGFTTHTRDIVLNSVTYTPDTGAAPTALQLRSDASVDTVDLKATFEAAGITKQELEGGLFDHASVYVFYTDYEDAVVDDVPMLSGRFGEYSHNLWSFDVSFLSLTDLLQQPIGRSVTATCDAVFGDARCGFDAATVEANHTVASDSADRITIAIDNTFTDEAATGVWTGARVAFTSGDNSGFSMEIDSYTLSNGVDPGEIVLVEPMPYDVAAAVTMTLTPACPKTRTACKDDFDNLVNFRGFPNIPGTIVVGAVGGQ